MKIEFDVILDDGWIEVSRNKVMFYFEDSKKDLELTWEELFERMNDNTQKA